MSTDKQHLQWVYDRMIHIHKENPNYDYMLRFQKILAKEALDEKIKIIDEICTRHPSIGTDKGWSWYVGGMKDDGDWHFRRMLDVPVEELSQFLEGIKAREEKMKDFVPEVDDSPIIRTENGWMREKELEMQKKLNEDFIQGLYFGEFPDYTGEKGYIKGPTEIVGARITLKDGTSVDILADKNKKDE